MKVNLSHGSVVKGSSHFADFHLLAFVLFWSFPRGQKNIPTVPQGIRYRLGDKTHSVSSQEKHLQEDSSKELTKPRTGQPTDQVGLAKGPAERTTPGTCVAVTGWDYKSQNAGRV